MTPLPPLTSTGLYQCRGAGFGGVDVTGGPIAFLALTTLLAGMIVVAAHKVFGLITWLPDNVMNWVGQHIQNLGEHNDEGRIRAIFGAAFGRGGEVGAGLMKPASPGTPDPGGPGPGTPTKTPGNGALAMGQAGGDGGVGKT